MNSQQKKTSGCASNLLAHEDLGHFEEAHRRNIQAKFYNEKFPLVYESDNIWDSLYEKHDATLKHKIWDSLYEEHGATLKHKCGKRIVTFPLLFFFFSLGGLLWPPFLFRLLWPFLFFLFFFSLAFLFFLSGQCSNNDDHHTLFTYNSRITTLYLEQNMTMWTPPTVYRDVQWSSVAMTSKNGQAMKTSC